ncbi:hypothetical protein [Neotamlana laminarinivorans]|uniref:Uncharacterized protein n=1 Tax=Neotamlana laminarinivorans TaxID=2883124 RepID=A0A9X1HYY7_9FLAO|nr:hypothetical protein [Tamlana laminarinivorans]MCB4797212.1 hypothetical protein [Tamlana laminarinivorans]
MTNRNRIILAVSGFIITLFLCYKFAFSKTINLVYTHEKLVQSETLFENTPHQIFLLKQKQKYYDSLLTKYQLNEHSIQHSLLNTINRYADSHEFSIVEFNEPHITRDNNLTVKVFKFTLNGNYNSIMTLIYNIEQHTKLGEVINIHFEVKKNFRTGQKYLLAHVLLKTFER